MKEKVECQQLPVKDLVCIMLISHCVEFIDMVATPFTRNSGKYSLCLWNICSSQIEEV